jgi:hypothetical protein
MDEISRYMLKFTPLYGANGAVAAKTVIAQIYNSQISKKIIILSLHHF